MKIKHFIFIVLSVFLLVEGCGKHNPEPVKQVFEVSGTTLSFSVDGGTNTLTITSSSSWQYSSNAAWISVTPPGRPGSDTPVEVSVTAGRNNGDERTATITFTSGSQSKTVSVVQEGFVDDGIPRVTIKEFRNKKDSSTDWYRLTGEVVSIENSEYGDIYIFDNTGYLYIYGLAPEKGKDKTDFNKSGVKPGDLVTIIACKKTYSPNSNTSIIEADPAYLENYVSGKYPGYAAAKASASWVELPATSGEDGFDYLCHLDSDGKRNYSIYYDKAARVPKWVSYPLTANDKASGRSDAYAYDPLISEEDQPYLTHLQSFKDRVIGAEEYVKGHMLPSAERSGRRNLDIFLNTNIIPQSSALNGGVWADLETKERNWAAKCDTLYITIGTVMEGSPGFVTDNANRKVQVPGGIFRAILALDKGEYKAIGAYFENKAYSDKTFSKQHSISIDELEKKFGIDLFANLPDDIEKIVEAENPADNSFWWQ